MQPDINFQTGLHWVNQIHSKGQGGANHSIYPARQQALKATLLLEKWIASCALLKRALNAQMGSGR
jgi:hypothetical protein